MVSGYSCTILLNLVPVLPGYLGVLQLSTKFSTVEGAMVLLLYIRRMVMSQDAAAVSV